MVQNLIQAVKANNFELVKSLKQDVNKTDRSGRTALIVAAKYGFVEMIECLQELGADIHAKSNMGKTPMHFAAMKNHVKAIKCLKDLGADLDAKDDKGNTPLHDAAKNNHEGVVEFLLSHKADHELENKYGLTALEIAFKEESWDVARRFIIEDAFSDGDVENILENDLLNEILNFCGTEEDIVVLANLIAKQDLSEMSYWNYEKFKDVVKDVVNDIKDLCVEDITKEQLAILSKLESLENKIQRSDPTEDILDDLYCIVDNKLHEIREEALKTFMSHKLGTRMNITENIAEYLTSEDLGNVVECMSLQNILDGLKKSQLQEARNILTSLDPKIKKLGEPRIKGLYKSNLKPLAKKARIDDSSKKNLAPKLLEIAQNFATFTDSLTDIMTEDCCKPLTTFKSKFDDLFDAVIKEQDSMQIDASRDYKMDKIGETSEAV